jgi:hypothetical protein
MKNKITAYSRKDGLLSLTLEGKEVAQTAKKGDEVTVKGINKDVDGDYVLWNANANIVQFSHSNNAKLSASADIPETHVTTEATAELEQQEHGKAHSAR